jgi:transcription elongation GreA/GreB family factor
MAWTPESVRCDDEGTCDEVVVTSEGAEPLRITDLEFRGEGAEYFESTDCEGDLLNQGDSCTITLGFAHRAAPKSVSAVLVIHQNFTGPATTVRIDAHGQGEPSTCTVPEKLVGKQQPDAEDAIEAAGLVAVPEERGSSSQEAGTVLDVDPAAGEEVACGSTVTITVSSGSGPETCTVPDVVGTQWAAAKAAIEDAGLVAVPEERESSSQEAGTVLDADPAAGEEVACGNTVTIVVSSGVG